MSFRGSCPKSLRVTGFWPDVVRVRTTAARRLYGASTVTAGLLVAATVAALVPAPAALAASSAPSSDACAALESTTRQADPVLGGGVTVSTGREGNLFPVGARPSLQVSAPGDVGETLHLTVRDRSTTVAQLDAPESSASVALPNRAGWFKVLVQRRVGGATVGATCLWYGVAPRQSSQPRLPAGGQRLRRPPCRERRRTPRPARTPGRPPPGQRR